MKYSHLALLLTCLQASQALIFDQQRWTFFIGGRFENRMHFFVFMGKLSIGPSALCMRHSIQWDHCTSFCWTLCRLGKKIHQSWMGDLQLSFLNRRSYHHQCLRPWGIGCKVCGCLHLSFTSLNTKSKNWPVAHLLWRNAFFSLLKQICALHFLPGELMSKQPPILRYHFIPGWTYFGGLDSWCVYSWPWPQFLWTCLAPALNETTSIT